MKIGIIGLGLIGGSIAKECKEYGYEVLGCDLNPVHVEQALAFNLVDKMVALDQLIAEVEIIGVCIPVDLIANIIPKILDKINPNQTVFDVGSTKKEICDAVRNHENRNRFVAAHPLAGTEFSGPSAAILNLFRNKKNLICEEELADKDAVQNILQVFEVLGMQSSFLNPNDHDKHMAYVSHLSHVSAFTLALTVLDIEKDEKLIFNLASTGFESTVRLAKSNPTTWSSIFDKNRHHLSDALENYIQHLTAFKKVIDEENTTKSIEMMDRANDIKRVLKGIVVNS